MGSSLHEGEKSRKTPPKLGLFLYSFPDSMWELFFVSRQSWGPGTVAPVGDTVPLAGGRGGGRLCGGPVGVGCVCARYLLSPESAPSLPVHGSPRGEETGCIGVWERQKYCLLKCELLQGWVGGCPRSMALPLVLLRGEKTKQCSVSLGSVALGLGVPHTLWPSLVLEKGTPLPCPHGCMA